MKPITDPKMERVLQPMLMLAGIPYLPHYSKPHLWHGPGGVVKSTAELMELQAKITTADLWPRHWTRALNCLH